MNNPNPDQLPSPSSETDQGYLRLDDGSASSLDNESSKNLAEGSYRTTTDDRIRINNNWVAATLAIGIFGMLIFWVIFQIWQTNKSVNFLLNSDMQKECTLETVDNCQKLAESANAMSQETAQSISMLLGTLAGSVFGFYYGTTVNRSNNSDDN